MDPVDAHEEAHHDMATEYSSKPSGKYCCGWTSTKTNDERPALVVGGCSARGGEDDDVHGYENDPQVLGLPWLKAGAGRQAQQPRLSPAPTSTSWANTQHVVLLFYARWHAVFLGSDALRRQIYII